MLDLTTAMAPHTFEVFNEERKLRAEAREWRRRYRAAVRAERADKREAKVVVITAPEHLAGRHTL